MTIPRRPSSNPESEPRATTPTPFDIQRYMPTPEAYQEAADDEAAEALLRRCFDRPEVKAAQEALRAAEEEDRRAEQIAAEKATAEGHAAAARKPRATAGAPTDVRRVERDQKRRPLLRHLALALVAVLTPAAIVAYFLSHPREPQLSAATATASASAMASMTVPLAPRTSEPGPTLGVPGTAAAGPTATALPNGAGTGTAQPSVHAEAPTVRPQPKASSMGSPAATPSTQPSSDPFLDKRPR